MAEPRKKRTPPTRNRTFRLRAETVAQLERRARQEHRSTNDLVQQLLDASLPVISVADEVVAISVAAGAALRGPLPKFDRDALYDDDDP